MNQSDSAEVIVSAIAAGDHVALNDYLSSGGDPNALYRDRCLLHWSAQESNVECVRLLLAAGARTEEHDEEDQFPLYQAAAEGSLEVASLLIEAGADVNHCTGAGSALILGCAYEHIDVVRYLIEAGADPSLADRHGATALSISIEFDSPDLIAELKKANKTAPVDGDKLPN